MKNPLCIYHGNCADGFGAAWVVKQYSENMEFHPGFYYESPPDVSDRDVVIVDFSYKRPVLDKMAKQAASLLILDHHKSAQADLAHLPSPGETLKDWERNFSKIGPAAALFDMERSGAVIAWEFFFPRHTCPGLLRYIQDRDLWRFSLPNSREVAEWVFSHPYDFDLWTQMIRDFDNDPRPIVQQGRAILRKKNKDIREMLSVATRWMQIGGHNVPVCNLPYMWGSDACHIMLDLHPDAPFAAYYWDKPVHDEISGTEIVREFGLRSRKGETDVSEIAVRYGGGGHANAAGFRIHLHRLGYEGALP